MTCLHWFLIWVIGALLMVAFMAGRASRDDDED